MARPAKASGGGEDGEDIEALIASATLREATVPLCLAGHLVGEYEELERQLSDAATLISESLAGSPRTAIAQRIEELRVEMAAHMRPFKFRALPADEWSDLLAAHPGKTSDQAFDVDTLLPAAVSACAVAPVMTLEQYQRLAKKLTAAQQEQILTAVWDLNTRALTSVPFSLAASATVASLTDVS